MRTLSLVVCLSLCSCGGARPAASTTATPSAPASASQFVQAIDVALAAHPGAKLYEVEIDDEGRAGFLEVEVFLGDVATELFVDPGTLQLVAQNPETPDADEVADHDALRTRFAAGNAPDLRALIAGGLFNSHAIETVREVGLTMLDGHIVVAVEVERDGGRSTLFHGADGAYLGTREEATTRLAQEPTAP